MFVQKKFVSGQMFKHFKVFKHLNVWQSLLTHFSIVLHVEYLASVSRFQIDEKWFLYTVCSVWFFMIFAFNEQLHLSHSESEFWQFTKELTSLLEHNMCITRQLSTYWSRRGCYWIRHNPCMNLQINGKLLNFCKSGRTVNNIATKNIQGVAKK